MWGTLLACGVAGIPDGSWAGSCSVSLTGVIGGLFGAEAVALGVRQVLLLLLVFFVVLVLSLVGFEPIEAREKGCDIFWNI